MSFYAKPETILKSIEVTKRKITLHKQLYENAIGSKLFQTADNLHDEIEATKRRLSAMHRALEAAR